MNCSLVLLWTMNFFQHSLVLQQSVMHFKTCVLTVELGDDNCSHCWNVKSTLVVCPVMFHHWKNWLNLGISRWYWEYKFQQYFKIFQHNVMRKNGKLQSILHPHLFCFLAILSAFHLWLNFLILVASSNSMLSSMTIPTGLDIAKNVSRHTSISISWLPIKQRIDYKICLLTYKTLTNQQPTYLYNSLSFPSHSVSTRSSDSLVLSIPYVRSSLGKRAFSVIGPRLWNSLPPDTRNSSSPPIFRSRFKTHLFKIAFPP